MRVLFFLLRVFLAAVLLLVGLGFVLQLGLEITAIWLLSVCVGTAAGQRCEAGFTGFLLAFFLGPLGAVLAFLVDNRSKCPHCAERVNTGAKLCPHCRTQLVAPVVRREPVLDADDWQNQHVDLTGHGQRQYSQRMPKPTAASSAPETNIDSLIDEALGTQSQVLASPPPPVRAPAPSKRLR